MRWFVDLGSDNYNMPSYFGSQRWTYFRLNNRSHNTLVIDDRLQEAPKEPCLITGSGEKEGERWLEIDLGPAYKKQASKVIRRAIFDEGDGRVEMEDELTKPVGPVRWAVVTDAKVTIEGRSVTLEKGGRRLVVKRKDGSGGDWVVKDATPPSAQEKQNEGFRVVSFTAPKNDRVRLQVEWALVNK